MDTIPDGRLLNLREALGLSSRRVESIKNIWKTRLGSILGEGDIKFTGREKTLKWGENNYSACYSFSYLPKGSRLSYTIKSCYDVSASGQTSERHASINVPPLFVGLLNKGGFLTEAESMSDFYSVLLDIEKALGEVPEPPKIACLSELDYDPNFFWVKAPEYMTQFLGDGYINVYDLLPDWSGTIHFYTKDDGYLFDIRNETVTLNPYNCNVMSLNIGNGKLEPTGNLTYLKRLIERISPQAVRMAKNPFKPRVIPTVLTRPIKGRYE